MSDRDRIDLTQAVFFLALGACGEVERAAELAGIDPALAWDWAAQLPRPSWYSRRNEAAARLFDIAGEAMAGARQAIRSEAGARPAVPLRELASVAERFYLAALKLDQDVGADGQHRCELDLAGWDPTPEATG